MVYGAAAAGVRVMTASSGPGLSLMQEGISYLAGAELPCVIVDVVRGGPGLGNIAPEQSDYFAMVKGGGHGNYRNLVLAPASVQEMADLTMLAFELADNYRNPGSRARRRLHRPDDGAAGTEYREAAIPEKPWAVKGTAETRKNLISSIYPRTRRTGSAPAQDGSQISRWRSNWSRVTSFISTKTPKFCWSATASCRAFCAPPSSRRAREGLRAGLFRPITLWPFPSQALVEAAAHVSASSGRRVEQRADGRRRAPGAEWQGAGGVLRTRRRQCSISRRSA